MADYKFKERCPCGDEVEFISYSSREMDSHVDRWRRIHRPHMTAIAKAIAESKNRPFVMPFTTEFNRTITQNMGTTVDGPKAQS